MHNRISTFLKQARILSLFLLMCWATSVKADLVMLQSQANHSKAPIGGKVDMLYFQLKGTNGGGDLSSITLSNDSSTVKFGTAITSIYLYRDTNKTGAFDASTSTLIKTLDFGGATSVTVTLENIGEQISSGSAQGYFIVYNIAKDPTKIGKTTNLTLTEVQDLNGTTASLSGQTTDVDVTLTGYSSIVVKNIAPKLVVPGQKWVPMLHLAIQVSGEDIDSSMAIKITNEGRNFVTNSSATNGVTNMYLYKDTVSGVFDPEFVMTDDNLIKSVAPGSFTSSSEGTFSLSSGDENAVRFPDGVTVNLFVVYDIGSSFSVTTSTQVYAQVTSLDGKGSESGLDIIDTTSRPANSASSYVAGLAYSNLSKMSVNGNFGAGTTVPIFQFVFTAYQASMNLSTITLDNNGTVPYITDATGVNGVTKVSIYSDNGNGTFDGADSNDTLVGNLSLGTTNSTTGQLNQKNRAVVPIAKPDNSVLRLLPYSSTAGGYPQDNTKLFFVVYTLGGSITAAQDASGNNTETITAALETALATSSLDNGSGKIVTQDINLSGTLPANASPVASVSLLNTNVYIKDIHSIAPSSDRVIQGQVKVPMLYFQLDSQAQFTSASVVIKNEKSTFFSDNTGVSKVWIYKDTNASGKFDVGDTFLASNDNMADRTYVTVSGVRIDQGAENRYLVLYDIGQKSLLSSSSSVGSENIRSQLSSIVSSLLLPGGELPNPQKAAVVSVAPKGLSVSIPTLQLTNIDDTTATFSMTIALNNATNAPILVTELLPRFYYGTLFGSDVSYEYSAKPSTIVKAPLVVSPSSEVLVPYDIKPYTNASSGTIILDAYVHYVTNEGQEAVLTRYNAGSSWSSAVALAKQLTVSKTPVQYSWTLPSYIDSMIVRAGETDTAFANGGAVQANSALFISFKNNGNTIDNTSLKVKLNGVSLSLDGGTSSTSPYFTYAKESGVLYVSNLGTSDGILEINVNDLEGKSLSTTTVHFSISSVVRIESPLFYPNPYHFGSTLYLGFNLTQKATLDIYVYNYLGVEVYRKTFSGLQIGYTLQKMDDLASVLSSGMYVCKMIATDINSNISRAVTRMAVY